MALLKVPQVADRLNCSQATAYALIESGQLPAVKIGAGGGGVRVTEQDLDSFIESRRIVPLPTPQVRKPKPKLQHISL